jgi:hypothetical protein
MRSGVGKLRVLKLSKLNKVKDGARNLITRFAPLLSVLTLELLLGSASYIYGSDVTSENWDGNIPYVDPMQKPG